MSAMLLCDGLLWVHTGVYVATHVTDIPKVSVLLSLEVYLGALLYRFRGC